jgi:FlaA1/EpsC-like NDP-sugar epimerase
MSVSRCIRPLKTAAGLVASETARLCERKSVLMPLDSLVMVLASSVAYLLGTVDSFPPRHLLVEGTYVLFVLVMRLPVFAVTGVYKSMWRYGSLPDATRVVRAMILSSGAAAAALVWLDRIVTLGPILLLDTFLALSGIMALRLTARYGARGPSPDRAVRTLIVGGGDAGAMMIRQMLMTPESNYLPVGILDDDPNKKGRTIHGVPVLGTCDESAAVASQLNAQAILITTPSADSPQMRTMVEKCAAAKLPIKTVPAIKDILDGRITVSQIREVKVEDLIDRNPVTHDKDRIESYLRGRTVLVTGAAGSIGSELCRMVLQYAPSALVALDISENGLFYLRNELSSTTNGCRFFPIVANLQSGMAVDHTMQRFRPHVVFHAAAHKHVPLMEENPQEAIKNNLRGAINVVLASERALVEKMVNISTDKAVNPTSIMGASKRLVELFIQDFSRQAKTRFCTVRFGNVMGSSGSVLPLFRRQIEQGGPVTVTHPSIRRFFMTISEAVSLVLQAAALGKGGEIFVLEMGEQLKITDLAKHLITLSGFRPGEDIKIEYTGLRPGEKIHEELWEPGECPSRTSHPHILVAGPAARAPRDLQAELRLLLHYADTMDCRGMSEVLATLLPGYRPRFVLDPGEVEGAADSETITTGKLKASAWMRSERPARRLALATAVGKRI